jgi:hypothetical protein
MPKPRGLEQIIEDFKNSAGDFLKFYNGMDSREKVLFRSWIHKLRIEAHSPLEYYSEREINSIF